MNTCQKRLKELEKIIKCISAQEADQLLQNGAKIIDVRTPEEYNTSHITDSIYLGRDYLEFKIEEIIPDKSQKIIITCGGGFRSLFAAESLIKLGYTSIYNLTGGFRGWCESNLPTDN